MFLVLAVFTVVLLKIATTSKLQKQMAKENVMMLLPWRLNI